MKKQWLMKKILLHMMIFLTRLAFMISTNVQNLILPITVYGYRVSLYLLKKMLVLFILLAFLESCGYMAVLHCIDRVFRKFGLSGKSFIPILIGTGCGVPGIMASRTIEMTVTEKMTIITTTFIPCGAKTPFIAMIAGAIFGGSAWVATSAYFIGMAAIIISGIMQRRQRCLRAILLRSLWNFLHTICLQL